MSIISRLFVTVVAVGALTGCQHMMGGESQKPVVMMDPAPVQRSFEMNQSDIAESLSNENVIVYAVDAPINDNKREFPEYRGVLENTTAGGYTVFDPGVTVYAVEGGTNMRPSYLPHYSVPQYAEQYRAAVVEPMYNTNQPLTPMAVVPLQTPTPIIRRSNRPWLDNQQDVNVGMPRAPQQDVVAVSTLPSNASSSGARRSPPMLTGY